MEFLESNMYSFSSVLLSCLVRHLLLPQHLICTITQLPSTFSSSVTSEVPLWYFLLLWCCYLLVGLCLFFSSFFQRLHWPKFKTWTVSTHECSGKAGTKHSEDDEWVSEGWSSRKYWKGFGRGASRTYETCDSKIFSVYGVIWVKRQFSEGALNFCSEVLMELYQLLLLWKYFGAI